MIRSHATSTPLRALLFSLAATFSLLASSVRAQAEADTINAVAAQSSPIWSRSSRATTSP